MVNINDYMDSDGYLDADDAQRYATAVATEVASQLEAQQPTSSKGTTMTKEIESAAAAVVEETKLNAKLIGGEALLENIETIADRLILSRLSWWKKLTISKTDKEMAVTLATYAIVHALKTGGFGLTKYRVNHAALDFVTVAANARLLKYVRKAAGIDTNVAAMLLQAPTVEVAAS